MGRIMVPISIEDVLDDLENDDLLVELRRRGVTALMASEALDNALREIEQAYHERDAAHFRIVLERIRALAE